MNLGFRPELLWSDALLFLLLAVVVMFAWRSARNEHLRAPWRRVARSRLGMSAAVVLIAYACIGIVDSLHYRPALPATEGQPVQYAAEVRSLLDVLTGELRTRVEDSYSAPFSLHLYSRETVTQPDGSQARVFPRLQHAGVGLADAAAARADIVWRGLRGIALGALGGALVLIVAAFAVGRRLGGWRAGWMAIRCAPECSGLRAGLATLIGLLVLGAIAVQLVPNYHVLGTDKVGTDVFYLSLKSVRTGLLIGTLTTLVTLPLALLLGLAAGYYGGRVDDVIQYLYTTLNSIPGVLLIASAVLVAQVQIELHPELFDTAAARSDLRLVSLCLILGMTSWTGLARLLRAETLKLREMDYIQAARAFGVSRARIIGRHIVPNVAHLVLITVAIDFSGLVLAEAVLSYVGVGVDPVTASWGNMINGARLELAREPMVWWQLSAAFVFMFALVLSANLFADSVRDAFDPRAAGQG
ncbi:MAG: ABC transporter permease [Gammaproteobacteria bacterium]|nr:ABC transporter permease [Gammaproteobacteria bacterium]